MYVIDYANDIVLYMESRFVMYQQLRKVESFFKACRMSLNAAKCTSLAVEFRGHIKKSAVIDLIFTVNDVPIWSISVGE